MTLPDFLTQGKHGAMPWSAPRHGTHELSVRKLIRPWAPSISNCKPFSRIDSIPKSGRSEKMTAKASPIAVMTHQKGLLLRVPLATQCDARKCRCGSSPAENAFHKAVAWWPQSPSASLPNRRPNVVACRAGGVIRATRAKKPHVPIELLVAVPETIAALPMSWSPCLPAFRWCEPPLIPSR